VQRKNLEGFERRSEKSKRCKMTHNERKISKGGRGCKKGLSEAVASYAKHCLNALGKAMNSSSLNSK
jgi:hypothetical protein